MVLLLIQLIFYDLLTIFDLNVSFTLPLILLIYFDLIC